MRCSKALAALALLAGAAVGRAEAPATSHSGASAHLQQPAPKRRKRSGLPLSGGLSQVEHLEPQDAAEELFVQRDGTMLSAGTLSSAPASPMLQRPQPSDTELGGMIALFDE
jgi:hypothetical protein